MACALQRHLSNTAARHDQLPCFIYICVCVCAYIRARRFAFASQRLANKPLWSSHIFPRTKLTKKRTFVLTRCIQRDGNMGGRYPEHSLHLCQRPHKHGGVCCCQHGVSPFRPNQSPTLVCVCVCMSGKSANRAGAFSRGAKSTLKQTQRRASRSSLAGDCARAMSALKRDCGREHTHQSRFFSFVPACCCSAAPQSASTSASECT